MVDWDKLEAELAEIFRTRFATSSYLNLPIRTADQIERDRLRKSDTLQNVAASIGVDVVDLQPSSVSPVDLRGIPGNLSSFEDRTGEISDNELEEFLEEIKSIIDSQNATKA